MQLSPRHETVFVSLYKIYGRSWEWSKYAAGVSDATGLYGDARITGSEIRRYVEYNRRRLQDMGLRFPQLPKRIDKERFAELYRTHGDKWTWAQYAEELSTQQGFAGKEAFTAASISAHVSRNRGDLDAGRRHQTATGGLPWPRVNLEAYKQTHYWRILLLYRRVQEHGESSLESSPDQLRRYRLAVNRLWRDGQVIRYDPDKGFYASDAHIDELESSAVLELEHHYYARHPEEYPKRRAKNT